MKHGAAQEPERKHQQSQDQQGQKASTRTLKNCRLNGFAGAATISIKNREARVVNAPRTDTRPAMTARSGMALRWGFHRTKCE
jgi:hypothetical protein